MKKKILSILLILSLIASMFILTACGENEKAESKENKKESSSKSKEVEVKDDGEKVIRKAIDAVNSENSEELSELIDLEAATEILGMDKVSKDDLINGADEVFDNNDFDFEIKEVKLLEDDSEVLEAIGMESYSQFEKQKDDDYIYYTVEVDTDLDSFKDFAENFYNSDSILNYIQEAGEKDTDNETKSEEKKDINKDIIALSENDGEYKIVMSAFTIFYMNSAVDATSSLSEMEILTFNQQFEIYSGKQIGSQVTSLLNKVISSNTVEVNTSNSKSKIVSIKYTDKDGETQTISDTNELTKIRTTIASKHYYTIEFEKNSDGYINCAVIKY